MACNVSSLNFASVNNFVKFVSLITGIKKDESKDFNSCLESHDESDFPLIIVNNNGVTGSESRTAIWPLINDVTGKKESI